MQHFFGLFLLFSEGGLKVLLGVLATLFVARFLGPENFGQYSYFITLSALALKVSGLFSGNNLVYHFQESEKEKYYRISMDLTIKWSFLLMALFVLAQMIGDSSISHGAWLITALPLMFTSFLVREAWMVSHKDFNNLALAKGGGSLSSFLWRMVLIYFGARWFWYVACLGVEMAVQSLIIQWRRRAHSFPEKVEFDKELQRQLLREGVGVSLGLFLLMLFLGFDTLWLKFFAGFSEVGLYSPGHKLLELCFLFVVIFGQWALPQMKGESGRIPWRTSLHWKLAATGVLLMLTVFFSSEWLVPVVLGEAYGASAKILNFLSLSLPGLLVLVFVFQIYSMNRQIKTLLISSGLLLVFKVLFNFAIPGDQGFLWSTCASIYLTLLLVFLQGVLP